jgi:Holliday junction DNA helicase RuvA
VIASLSGTVTALRPDSVVLSVGGVGLSVLCAPNTIATTAIGDSLTLFTTLIVREDSLTLFGFGDIESREHFELIQSVNGFGPKLAFAVIAFLTPDALRRAIATSDIARLTAIPGVGLKSAQRLVLELKDKMIGPENLASQEDWRSQVTTALLGLGWSSRDAGRVLDELGDVGSLPLPEVLRLALQNLGNAR